MPAAWNHSAISRLSAAAPEMKKRTRPPKRSRILVKTSLSNSACCLASRNGTGLPSRCELVDLEADLEGLVEDLLLQAALGGLHGDDPAVRLLEDARRGAHERRADHGEVVDDLVDPAVDRGREAAGELGGEQHLAERVRHRQPQELQVVLVEDVLRLDRRALVGPATGAAAARPWAGRWCRRCRSGWPASRAGWPGDRARRRRPGARPAAPAPSSSRSASAITQSPSVAPSKVTTLARCGSSDLCSRELGDLLVVLGEHDPALGVGQDVGDVLGVGRGVDRRGRGAGAHDGQVGEDPLEAGARRRCRPAARARCRGDAGRRRRG